MWLRALCGLWGGVLLVASAWLAGARAPDAEFILFLSNRDGNAELYLMSAAGGDSRRITQTADLAMGQGFCWAAWLPGGDGLLAQFGPTSRGAFYCSQFGRALYSLPRFGGDLGEAFLTQPNYPRAMAPDGRAVLTTSPFDRGGLSELRIHPIDDDQDSLILAELRSRNGAEIALWSPDDAWIVYSDDVNRNLALELYRVTPEGVRDDAPPYEPEGVRACSHAAISPDGAWLVFAARQQTLCDQLWRTRLDAEAFGAAAEPFAELPDGLTTFSPLVFNPAGDALAAHSDGQIWRVGVADGAVTPIASGGTQVSWSPDGAWLAFHHHLADSLSLYRARADGSGLERLTDHPGDDINPRYSPPLDLPVMVEELFGLGAGLLLVGLWPGFRKRFNVK